MKMDENDDGDVFRDSVGNPSEKFHRSEAISAVADEGFLGEEDDDYEDLYNDVNIGEGFLQSLRKNEDLGFRNEEVEKKVEPPPPPPEPSAPRVAAGACSSIPGAFSSSGGGGGSMERKFETGDVGARVPGRVEGFQNVGYRGDEIMSGRGSGMPGQGGLRVALLGQTSSSAKVADLEEQTVSNSLPNQGIGQHSQASVNVGGAGNVRNAGNDAFPRQGGGNVNGAGGHGFGSSMDGGVCGGPGSGIGGGGGGTILFVGDLHWWTTDAELEAELCKYGPVKEVKLFDEKASGKSKGYCQVEFYDPAAASACKEGMNGHVFDGRPCVVAFASPFSVKRMGESQVNRNQQMAQAAIAQAKKGPGDVANKTGGSNITTVGNYQCGSDNNRGYGRGNWGRGNAQGMGSRGLVGPRNRVGGMGGRGMMGNGGSGFGQGIGATHPLLHPQTMMGQGFDPAFGGPMGRMGGYGGFPGAPAPPFSGILSQFPPVGGVGLPGVAPHVNMAFFGRGMPMNGMGMMPGAGVEGQSMGMWSDPNMGGWAGEEHGLRAGESSYGEEVMSDHQYGEVSHDRGTWQSSMKEKDRGSERDWSRSSDRRYREDMEPEYERKMPREKDIGHDPEWSKRRHREDRDIGRDWDHERDRDRERDRHRDERDKYTDHHRYRERESEYDDEWDKGRSSRTHSKSRLSHEEEPRSRSRDADYGKRRRLNSE